MVLTGDGGGKVPALARSLRGRNRVARMLHTLMRVAWMRVADFTLRPTEVNGGPGVMVLDGQQRLISVWSLEIAGGEIRSISSVVNPDKLAHLGLVEELTEQVRAAILETRDRAWIPALDQDGSERDNGDVVEITDRVDLSTWPQGSRLTVRRERPHPGAQLSFTDHDGYRFQAILTEQIDPDIAILERRHRQSARVEDRIRDDKDTGLAKLPFKKFALNEAWLEIVLLAHDLIVWTQALVPAGEPARGRPETTALPTAARRRPARVLRPPRELHLQNNSPWTEALKTRSRNSRRSPPSPPADRSRRRDQHPSRPARPPATSTTARKRREHAPVCPPQRHGNPLRPPHPPLTPAHTRSHPLTNTAYPEHLAPLPHDQGLRTEQRQVGGR